MGPKTEEEEKKEENPYQSHSYSLYRERRGQYDEFQLAVVKILRELEEVGEV